MYRYASVYEKIEMKIEDFSKDGYQTRQAKI